MKKAMDWFPCSNKTFIRNTSLISLWKYGSTNSPAVVASRGNDQDTCTKINKGICGKTTNTSRHSSLCKGAIVIALF